MPTLSQATAQHLLTIQSVVLSPDAPFTWSSGLKAPIYCDNRLTMSYPEVRRFIAKGLSQLIQVYYSEAEVIAGTATAGIPHAAWVSDLLELPMVYVRGSMKNHGKKKQIEGLVKPKEKVVIIEDLISTGGSVLTAVEALREEGANVIGSVAIMTYGLSIAKQQFAEARVPFHTLTDFSTLIDLAKEKQLINETQKKMLERWYQNPTDDAWMNEG